MELNPSQDRYAILIMILVKYQLTYLIVKSCKTYLLKLVICPLSLTFY